MHCFHLNTLAAFALAALARAADSSVPIPSQDSFYTPPNNVSSYAPGEVIKTRQVSNQLNGQYTSSQPVKVNSSHQYMYRTTDSLGNPVAAVMTLLIPNNPDLTKLWAHQTAYDSNNPNCVPSYALRSGANQTSETDIIYISAALNNGWPVATADFYGLSGQLSAGVMAGQATLDAVRAALNGGHQLGLSASPRIGLWGYSGGSVAVEWATELQPKYAPELKFVGAAIGGISTNLNTVLLSINKGISAGLGFAGLHGLANAYPSFSQFLNQSLIPSKKSEFYSIGGGCLNDVTSAGAFKDIWSYMTQGQAFLNAPTTASTLTAGGLAGQHGTPTMPLFIIESVNDEIQPIALTDAFVQALCRKGATIEYHRDYFGEHITEALTEGPTAFQWLADRLNNKPFTQKGCITRNTFVNTFNPSQYPALGTLFVSYLQTLFAGGNLGNSPSIVG